MMKSIYLLLTLGLFVSAANAKYGGGAGTAEDPYLISSPEHLVEISSDPNDWGYHFSQTDSIDMSLHNDLFIPIGEQGFISFTGNYNGQNYEILSLGQNMFGNCSNANLLNINIVNSNVSSLSILANRAINKCFISNCFVQGALNGGQGGLVGYAENCIIQSCSSNVVMTGSTSAGCLLGLVFDSYIINCHSSGSISGSRELGGLFSKTYKSSFDACYSNADVYGTDEIGGFGYYLDWSTISNSYSTGTVSANNSHSPYAAGFVYRTFQSTISKSYTISNTKNPSSGGFCRTNGSSTGGYWDCIWNRDVTESLISAAGVSKSTTEMQDIDTYLDMGWDFVGESTNGTGDIWQMSPVHGYPEFSDNLGAIPNVLNVSVEQAQLLLSQAGYASGELIKTSSRSVMAGTVIATEPSHAMAVILGHQIDIIVSTGPYGGGDGTELSPYIISNGDHFYNLTENEDDWDKHFVLTEEIHLSDQPYHISGPDGGFPFSGSFDGQGHAIYNLHLGNPIGLFGYVEGGTIRNLGLVNIQIEGVASPAGGLVSTLDSGTVENCFTSGRIIGDYSVGGLVGENRKGTIRNSYSNCDVSGDAEVGGLVGANGWRDPATDESYGEIVKCFSTGNVSGREYVGGLVGANRNIIKACYHEDGAVTNTQPDSSYIGGFVGNNQGPISMCYSIADVGTDYSTGRFFGGFAGKNQYEITNCYNRGSVKAFQYAGGFAGISSSQIINCYCYRREFQMGHPPFVYGGSIQNCFMNELTAGQQDYPGFLVYLTDSEMTDSSHFTLAGWDWVNETANGQKDTWFNYPGTFPVLYYQAKPGDTNYDAITDMSDISIFMENWMGTSEEETTGVRLIGDFNEDGTFDMWDFSILASEWLKPL